MAIYNYMHLDEEVGQKCSEGLDFDWKQSVKDLPLNRCPYCGGLIKRQMGLVYGHAKKSNAELKDLGFTKLVRVDEGIFENVTRRKGDSKYVDRRDPETLPDLSKTIED